MLHLEVQVSKTGICTAENSSASCSSYVKRNKTAKGLSACASCLVAAGAMLTKIWAAVHQYWYSGQHFVLYHHIGLIRNRSKRGPFSFFWQTDSCRNITISPATSLQASHIIHPLQTNKMYLITITHFALFFLTLILSLLSFYVSIYPSYSVFSFLYSSPPSNTS